MSAQAARTVVQCVECRKPRVVYAKTKIDIRHNMTPARNISCFEFSCAMEVEIPYCGAELGRTNVCSHCGDPESSVNVELKTKL